MRFFKNILSKNHPEVTTYSDFWRWFEENASQFYKDFDGGAGHANNFFKGAIPRMNQLIPGINFKLRKKDTRTINLLFTSEGNLTSMGDILDLVECAPAINGWHFQALYAERNLEDLEFIAFNRRVRLNDFSFAIESRAEEQSSIFLHMVYTKISRFDKKTMTQAMMKAIFAAIGELKFALEIDDIILEDDFVEGLGWKPIRELAFSINERMSVWEKNFSNIEFSYDDRPLTSFEGKSGNGNVMIATIIENAQAILNKTAYPVGAVISFRPPRPERNGLPNAAELKCLEEITEEMHQRLKELNGAVYLGHRHFAGQSQYMFACKKWREVGRIFREIKLTHPKYNVDYDLVRDADWSVMLGLFSQSMK